MEKIILIKYGELNTKKGNIDFFIKRLYSNILKKLKDDNVLIKRNVARMYIELKDDNEEMIINKLKEVFGIHGIVLAYKISSNFEAIKDNALLLLRKKSFKTFKVETKRADKRFAISSMEVSKQVGAHILKNIDNIMVDVNNPECVLNIEIRADGTYLYTNQIPGLGGYPSGIQGKGLLMLSGGIDSPVAGFLALKRGIELECVYFESPPHTSQEAQDKVKKLVQKLTNYTGNIKLHIIPFTKLQEIIYQNVDPKYNITIMRRMMYRISEALVKKIKGYVIINGESIGQVASQTLTSMSAINSVTSIPVIRPVACMDKLEIISLAKKIETYDISILPFEDCCTIFVPEHPVINPDIEKCIKEEQKFNYQKLVNDCVENVKTVVINDSNLDNFNDLL